MDPWLLEFNNLVTNEEEAYNKLFVEYLPRLPLMAKQLIREKYWGHVYILALPFSSFVNSYATSKAYLSHI